MLRQVAHLDEQAGIGLPTEEVDQLVLGDHLGSFLEVGILEPVAESTLRHNKLGADYLRDLARTERRMC